MDTIKGLKRTNYCGDLRIEDVGKEVTLFGWCQRQRDLGNLIFIDLRDRTGLIQLSFNDTTDREVFAKAQSVRAEYVVAAVGTVCERESKTNKIATGDIEINVKEFRIISKAETPPFEIAKSEKVGDETTLKYRYLNLRNEKLTQNILMRHKIAKIAREYFYDNDFIEIETPMMIKSTPEGARDYVVPSRVHNGKFYALPQSPQIYKQLCMIAGFDRYIQLARCFRDEDLRADRQPEFTQIDLEMSFVDTDDIMQMAEGFIKKLMKETIDVDIDFPLPRMTFAEAQEKYGSDKPDTRFGMLIQDITAWADKTDFIVFKNAIQNGGSVRAIVAKSAANVYTRKKIDKLTEHAKGIGAKGLAYIRWADEAPTCSFNKFLKDGELDELIGTLGVEKGDCVFIVSDKTSGDFLVLAGSIPNSLPNDIYEEILAKLQNKGINFAVDATGDLLLNVLKYKPFLIKPNHHELGDIFGVEVKSEYEIAHYARKLQEMGARNVLVSRSKDGATLIDENGEVHSMGNVPSKVINPVGCGDSMVAGFVAGYTKTHDYKYALKLGSACGNATAFCSGLADKATIDLMLKSEYLK